MFPHIVIDFGAPSSNVAFPSFAVCLPFSLIMPRPFPPSLHSSFATFLSLVMMLAPYHKQGRGRPLLRLGRRLCGNGYASSASCEPSPPAFTGRADGGGAPGLCKDCLDCLSCACYVRLVDSTEVCARVRICRLLCLPPLPTSAFSCVYLPNELPSKRQSTLRLSHCFNGIRFNSCRGMNNLRRSCVLRTKAEFRQLALTWSSTPPLGRILQSAGNCSAMCLGGA